MALQKKVNKLQVEHVSEEEVDQLFYALEVKEQQLRRDDSSRRRCFAGRSPVTARGEEVIFGSLEMARRNGPKAE